MVDRKVNIKDYFCFHFFKTCLKKKREYCVKRVIMYRDIIKITTVTKNGSVNTATPTFLCLLLA